MKLLDFIVRYGGVVEEIIVDIPFIDVPFCKERTYKGSVFGYTMLFTEFSLIGGGVPFELKTEGKTERIISYNEKNGEYTYKQKSTCIVEGIELSFSSRPFFSLESYAEKVRESQEKISSFLAERGIDSIPLNKMFGVEEEGRVSFSFNGLHFVGGLSSIREVEKEDPKALWINGISVIQKGEENCTIYVFNEDLKRRRIAEEKQNEKEYQQWIRDGRPGTIADHYGF